MLKKCFLQLDALKCSLLCVFLFQTDEDDADYSYDLFSVIIHKGGCYGGHYHVYIRDIDQLGQWEPPVRKNKKENPHFNVNKLIIIHSASPLCCCQEEDCKPKTQRKVKEEAKEVCEPKLQEDDPLSVLTAIIAQVLQQHIFISSPEEAAFLVFV